MRTQWEKVDTLRQDAELVLSRQAKNGTRMLSLRSTGTTSSGVQRLEHEYSLRSYLDPTWAAQPLELVRAEGASTLWLSDPGGKLLAEIVGTPWDIEPFLRVAIGLTQALGAAHSRELIHKDIKPANILTDPDTGEAWLLCFGIASRLPRERATPDPPSVIAGTLAYMAPEQTGRMNRSVDARSDLYSLGVTLYEMLTGELPFAAAEPMEWVHCQLAREAPLISDRNRRVPEPLCAIVAKLLAKPAESRYQTAAGLKADLRRCLKQLEQSGAIESFPLGERDVPDRLMIPERLYGREPQIERLLLAFDRVVAEGEAGVVLVSGYSGIGKSSVVNELHKALVGPRGLFASGKFDQFRRDVPYATLAQAFGGLVRMILAESEASLGKWRAALVRAMGPNGKLMTDLIPELEVVVGVQPPVADLPAAEAEARFQSVFREFIGVFAQPAHPLALFLDDLQWLDAATLKLFEALVSKPLHLPLLLVGAYRSNEVNAAHPLSPALDHIRKSGAHVQELALDALTADQVRQLVADALRAADAGSLAEIVYEKAGGNPYFTLEFLAELAHEKLLTFGVRSWTWNAEAIRGKGYTDNVVDLMTAKLARLDPRTQEALKQLACLGSQANEAMLALVQETPVETVREDLWSAVHSGLVLRQADAYAFPHDRVQEAAYALTPIAHLPAAHLRIGRLLLSRLEDDGSAESLFEVVSQLNRAVALIDQPEECATLRRLNLQAARRAKATTAYVSARSYITQATTLLPEDAWSSAYQEAFEMYLLLAECEFLVGHLAPADELFELILQRTRSLVDRTTALCVRLQLLQVAGRYEEGFSAARDALKLFDIVLPDSDAELQAAVAAELEQVPILLGDQPISRVDDGEVLRDPSSRALIELLVYAGPCAYIASTKHFPLVTLQAVTLSLRAGNTEVSCRAYAAFAVMLVAMFDVGKAYDFSEMALRLNEKLGKPRDRGSLLLMHGHMVVPWKHPFSEGLPIQDRAFAMCLEAGDLAYAGYLAFLSVWQLLERGDTLDEVLAGSARYSAFARDTNNEAVLLTIRFEQQFVKSLQGKTEDPLGMEDASFDESSSIAALTRSTFGTGIAFYYIMKEILAFHHGRHEHALAAASAGAPFFGSIMSLAMEATHSFYHALTLSALLSSASPDDKQAYQRIIGELSAKFGRWAAQCPENFGARSSLLQAELARAEGRVFDALRLYEDAIYRARESRIVQDEALAFELLGQLYESRGLDATARGCFRNACLRYGRWGAHAKVQQLVARRPYLREEAQAILSTTTIGTPVEQLDLGTVVSVLQALTGEIVLEKWIEKLMTLALENAGAQRGLLLIPEGDELKLLAEASIGEKGVRVRAAPSSSDGSLPQSVLRYVLRTREVVLVDEAATSPYAADPYVVSKRSQAILCLPLVKQGKLEGILYLENNIAPGAFTARRTALLELLASQAAISLENARLYTNLQQENEARRQTEKALRRSEAFLAHAQRLSSTGSFGWSPRQDELVWSEETYRIFGFDRSQKPRLADVIEVIHPDDRPRVHELVERVTRQGEDFETEYRIVLPDGKVKHLLVLAQSIGAPGISEFLGAVMDVTAAKEMAEALAFRDRVMAILGHDLRNPLSAVLGTVGLRRLVLENIEGELADSARSHLTNIHQAASRMREMIDTLLDFSQTRFAGKLPVSPTQMDLGELCGRVVRELAASHSQRIIDMEATGDACGVWDPGRIAQVASNLIGNALTHGDETSPVRVSIEGEQRDVLLKVHNRGAPIAAEQIPALFEPFRRGPGTNGTAPRGIGLGLHIAEQIVKAHGGSITVESSTEGTTFTVRLPRGE